MDCNLLPIVLKYALYRDIEYDNKRQKEIEYILGCKFIRYKPYENGFNIFNLLNEIYKHISQ